MIICPLDNSHQRAARYDSRLLSHFPPLDQFGRLGMPPPEHHSVDRLGHSLGELVRAADRLPGALQIESNCADVFGLERDLQQVPIDCVEPEAIAGMRIGKQRG